MFAAKITLSIENQHSLPKLHCLQWICVRYQNCVYNESTFVAQNCVVCNELAFTAESACSAVNMWFAAEIDLFAAN